MFGLFNKKEEVSYKELVTKGAVIIDVRSKEEFAGGHVEGAINLPLDKLISLIEEIGKNKDINIITCCMSGGRSSVAKTILNQGGYKNVHDGGGWQTLQSKL